MDRLDDIQTALKLFKKWEKFEIHFMTILELAELFKTINWPDPTRLDHNALCRLISQKNIRDRYVKI